MLDLGPASGWRLVTNLGQVSDSSQGHTDKQSPALTHTQYANSGPGTQTHNLLGSAIMPQFIFTCSHIQVILTNALRNVQKVKYVLVSLQIRPLTLQTLLPSSSTSLPTPAQLTSGGQVTAHSPTLPPSSQCHPACLPLLPPSPSLPSSCRPVPWEPYRPKICRRAAAEVECHSFWSNGTSTRFSVRIAIAM